MIALHIVLPALPDVPGLPDLLTAYFPDNWLN